MNELRQRKSDPSQHKILQIEAARTELEGREATDPSVRLRGLEFRGDGFLGLRLRRRQRNEEIVKRGSPARRTTFLQKKKTYERNKFARSSADAELYAAAL